jgi:membrane protein required for colicin V production
VRGFVRESIALLAWLGGLWLAWRYAPLVEPMLDGLVGDPPVSTWVARAIIVLSVVVIGWLAAAGLTYILRHSSLSIMVDRLLGAFFGVLRGAVVVAVFVMLAQTVRLQEANWWNRSRLLPYATEFAGWIGTFAETGMKLLDPATSSDRGS